jgi:hypothetical protein
MWHARWACLGLELHTVVYSGVQWHTYYPNSNPYPYLNPSPYPNPSPHPNPNPTRLARSHGNDDEGYSVGGLCWRVAMLGRPWRQI